jgi:DNA-binding CsgD family transcriptional regulator
MDWSAVVMLVAERTGLAALLLSRDYELLLVSPAAKLALGMNTPELGSNWVESHVMQDARASARWHLERVLAGALRKLELPLRTGHGPVVASFDACPVGEAPGGALLVLDGLRPIPPERPLAEYDYEVGAVASGSPKLLRLFRGGAASEAGEGRCFEVLHGRSLPCEKCPLRSDPDAHGPTLVVTSRPPNDYVVTSAIIRGDEARVSVRSISSASLAAVMLARLEELAERARLSKRERSVFAHLMDGRAVEEIASELEISPRTVKFHQANVLQKLGADSRIDLMRLVR